MRLVDYPEIGPTQIALTYRSLSPVSESPWQRRFSRFKLWLHTLYVNTVFKCRRLLSR